MKEKFLSITLAAILAFSCVGLSACGSSSSAKSKSTFEKWSDVHGYYIPDTARR